MAQHKIREVIKAGLMELAYLYTKDLVADVLTKPLTGPQHLKLIRGMGMAMADKSTVLE